MRCPMQIKVRFDSRLAKRGAERLSKERINHAARVLAPTLLALTLTAAAHAQGTMDFSGAQTLMGTFKTFAVYAGAVICFGGLIFAGVRMMSGKFQDAIPGLFGALFGAGVLGWGAGWIGPPAPRRASSGRSQRLPRPPQFGGAEVQHRTDCREDRQESGVCGRSAPLDRTNAERRGCFLP